jgi:hypothetical protein
LCASTVSASALLKGGKKKIMSTLRQLLPHAGKFEACAECASYRNIS